MSLCGRAAYVLFGLICILWSGRAASAQTPKIWLEDFSPPCFSGTLPVPRSEMEILSARNATIAFQVVVRNEGINTVARDLPRDERSNLTVIIRRVGYVPMPHRTRNSVETGGNGGPLPGMVPDPLFREHVVSAGPAGSDAFWITVKVPASTAPGTHDIKVHLDTEGDARHPANRWVDLTVHINVKPLTLRPRHDFPFTQWWSADAIYDAYHTTHSAKPGGTTRICTLKTWLIMAQHDQRATACRTAGK